MTGYALTDQAPDRLRKPNLLVKMVNDYPRPTALGDCTDKPRGERNRMQALIRKARVAERCQQRHSVHEIRVRRMRTTKRAQGQLR